MKSFLKFATFLLLIGVFSVLGLELYEKAYPNYETWSEARWKRVLSQAQYEVLREGATEDAYSGQLLNEKRSGTYRCVGCSSALFSSVQKFDSGTGWPSYRQAFEKAVSHHKHNTALAVAVEVKCRKCKGHLGHVFPDGPPPSHRRYCINSLALSFEVE